MNIGSIVKILKGKELISYKSRNAYDYEKHADDLNPELSGTTGIVIKKHNVSAGVSWLLYEIFSLQTNKIIGWYYKEYELELVNDGSEELANIILLNQSINKIPQVVSSIEIDHDADELIEININDCIDKIKQNADLANNSGYLFHQSKSLASIIEKEKFYNLLNLDKDNFIREYDKLVKDSADDYIGEIAIAFHKICIRKKINISELINIKLKYKTLTQ